jgi:hypothetical protein
MVAGVDRLSAFCAHHMVRPYQARLGRLNLMLELFNSERLNTLP